MVLQAVNDYPTVIRSVSKHLKENGRVIVTVPAFTKQKAENHTARHELLGYDNRQQERVEKMFWGETDRDWTYKYNRDPSLYDHQFASNGLAVKNFIYPIPVEAGRCDDALYQYHLQTKKSVLIVYGR